LVKRVQSCLEAGASAAGCVLDREPIGRVYYDMVTDAQLLELFVASAAKFGRTFVRPDEHTSVIGSTDMGNVSHVVPSIHPLLQIGPEDVALHTRAFADYASGPQADSAVIDGAAAMALCALRWLAAVAPPAR
jgi:metal-dependent amidase/aminoacylase/carboxypeptidase family protein